MALRTGGKLLDKGGYGCIFVPPLVCKDTRPSGKDDMNTIDKLMKANDAKEEFTIGERVRRLPLWKNYFIVADMMCVPAPANQQKDKDIGKCKVIDTKSLEGYRLLRMRFGGQPLDLYRMNIYAHKFGDFAKHIIEAGALLSLFGIVHRDLHFGNILVDSENVPRIIDYNLSIDVQRPVVRGNLLHTFSVNYIQEPPDYCLINGLIQGMDGYDTIEKIVNERQILGKLVSVLGIGKAEMREQLVDFYGKSKLIQNNDIEGWFRTYWDKIDSWSIGVILTKILSGLMLWPQFRKGELPTLQQTLIPVLREMCNFDPSRRINCVVALAKLDPQNFIVKKFGREWTSVQGDHLHV